MYQNKRKPLNIMFKIKFTSYYLEITRRDLVITKTVLEITRKDLVNTRTDLVITRKVSRNYEKRSRYYEKIMS